MIQQPFFFLLSKSMKSSSPKSRGKQDENIYSRLDRYRAAAAKESEERRKKEETKAAEEMAAENRKMLEELQRLKELKIQREKEEREEEDRKKHDEERSDAQKKAYEKEIQMKTEQRLIEENFARKQEQERLLLEEKKKDAEFTEMEAKKALGEERRRIEKEKKRVAEIAEEQNKQNEELRLQKLKEHEIQRKKELEEIQRNAEISKQQEIIRQEQEKQRQMEQQKRFDRFVQEIATTKLEDLEKLDEEKALAIQKAKIEKEQREEQEARIKRQQEIAIARIEMKMAEIEKMKKTKHADDGSPDMESFFNEAAEKQRLKEDKVKKQKELRATLDGQMAERPLQEEEEMTKEELLINASLIKEMKEWEERQRLQSIESRPMESQESENSEDENDEVFPPGGAPDEATPDFSEVPKDTRTQRHKDVILSALKKEKERNIRNIQSLNEPQVALRVVDSSIGGRPTSVLRPEITTTLSQEKMTNQRNTAKQSRGATATERTLLKETLPLLGADGEKLLLKSPEKSRNTISRQGELKPMLPSRAAPTKSDLSVGPVGK
eukprot:TRINITY_DN2865_c0_g1_i2.p1 TRINITY_DN2865_c0_g1~~TRINITY_DN2865_c0_g1_i2.p1  ORF type:complete len:553 (-),score=214.14 TRINITY_DN2865_c0_g1_i2:729-2387(-)